MVIPIEKDMTTTSSKINTESTAEFAFDDKTEYNTLPTLSSGSDCFQEPRDPEFKDNVADVVEKNQQYVKKREERTPQYESNTGVPQYKSGQPTQVETSDQKFGYVASTKRCKRDPAKKVAVTNEAGDNNSAGCYLNYNKNGLAQVGIQGQALQQNATNNNATSNGGYGVDYSESFQTNQQHSHQNGIINNNDRQSQRNGYSENMTYSTSKISGIGNYDSSNENISSVSDMNGYYDNNSPLNLLNEVSRLYNIGDHQYNIGGNIQSVGNSHSPSMATPKSTKKQSKDSLNSSIVRKASASSISSAKTAKFDKNDERIQKLVARIERIPSTGDMSLSEVNGTPNKQYGCEICGKRYKNQGGVKYHYFHHAHTDEEIERVLSQPPRYMGCSVNDKDTIGNVAAGSTSTTSNSININPMLISASNAAASLMGDSNSTNNDGLPSLSGDSGNMMYKNNGTSPGMSQYYSSIENHGDMSSSSNMFHHQNDQHYGNYLSNLTSSSNASVNNVQDNQSSAPSLSTLTSLLANDS